MSSAISTKGEQAERPDDGFRPSHFFVLASLVAATAAVVLSRQARPEHLVLISLTIGAAGAAAAAVYRTLVPLTARDVTLWRQRQSERARAAVEREKSLVLRSIKELEFDRAMGKVSPTDFEEMSARLRARAMMLIKQADEGGSGYRELIERELSARLVTKGKGGAAVVRDVPAAVATPAPEAGTGRECAGCRTANDMDALFCKGCGTRLKVMTR
jgi:hypothetical protein